LVTALDSLPVTRLMPALDPPLLATLPLEPPPVVGSVPSPGFGSVLPPPVSSSFSLLAGSVIKVRSSPWLDPTSFLATIR